jgi:aromatic-L-amino-acid/L-tryptophan decarboxylase
MTANMTPEEFRRHGHAVVDWIAGYMERIESFPVLARVAPGEVRAQLPAHAPQTGQPFESLLSDMDNVILPGLTHWQHPSFFGYYPANASGPAILGDLLAAGLGVQGMLWATSPACTELEEHVLDWLAELLALPERFRSTSSGGGVIQDSASSSALVALVAARHRASGRVSNLMGMDRHRYTVYGSSQAHSALEKAVRVAGIGSANLRMVDVDERTLAMDPGQLAALIASDVAAGAIPTMVLATVGTTSTCAFDPLRAIGEVCRNYDIWLHVDAAYAGVAAVCPELRWIHDGLDDYADSYCTNPHKWLLTNFDCDAFYVADRAALIDALSILPEFLRNAATESGMVTDYRDWQIPLGRRFRALKLWAVIRWYGVEGLRTHIRRHVALAQELIEWMDQDDRFEVVAPHPLSLVCFRLRGPNGPNEALLNSLNASGRLYLTHTKVNGAFTLRLALGGTYTERLHVEAAWAEIQRAATDILREHADTKPARA